MKTVEMRESFEKTARAKVLGVAFCALLFALCVQAEAQQSAKVPRIAYLSGTFIIPANTEAFKQGLHDLGYIEGKNIVVEWRFAEQNRDRLRALASELVRLKVDVIVATWRGRYPRSEGSDEHNSYRHGAG